MSKPSGAGSMLPAHGALQYAVSRALAGSTSIPEAAAAVLHEICTRLNANYGSFWLVNEVSARLIPLATWPAGDTAFRDATLSRTFKLGEGLPGQVWQTRAFVWVPVIAEHREFPRVDAANAAGIRAGVGFPITISNITVGVIELFSESSANLPSSLEPALTGVGLQFGEFIARVRATQAERASRMTVEATLEAALDSVVMIDAKGTVLEFNKAAEATFGYSRREAIGRVMAELIVPPHLRDAHSRGMARYLATGEAHVLGKRIEITAMRANGAEFPVELGIQRVPVEGPPIFTAYIRDLTEHKRLMAAQRLLLDASAVLTSTLDYEQTLRNLSDVVIPEFADWYAADVVGSDGAVRRVETAHRDPEKVAIAADMARRYPPDPADTHGVHEVVRTGRSLLVAQIPDDLLRHAARDATHLEMIRGLGLQSYVIVPMPARRGVIGALTLVYAESGRHYDERDLVIAEDLGRRAAQAIENAQLFAAVDDQREMLEQQATELEMQTVKLVETATEANAANEAKSTFLASMSHELRTPLNAIIGYAQLLESGVRGPMPPQQIEDMGRITRSAKHLLGLINDVLSFAKVEAGHVEFDIEPLEVGPILAGVEELVAPQARAKQLACVFQDASAGARVCGDRDKVTQIVVNLLSNAIRHTDNGGRIEVRAHATAESVRIDVSDTGSGIPADKHDEIFAPFVQLNRGFAGGKDGTGLGLAISRNLARGMGGELTVSSEVGKGSTFSLELKRDRAKVP